MAEQSETGKTPITIKKYANRRLYNTATSSYVTLDHLCQMVKEGVDFVVYDAKTGEDITRSVLTQIIVEEEAKGQNLLPINFLRQLISFYGDNLQFLLPGYLDQSMESFARNQEQMRRYMQDSFGGMFPFGRFEEMSKQNLAFFEKAMKMFVPFKGEGLGEPGEGKAAEGNTGGGATPGAAQERGGDAALASLKDQVDALQKQLEALSRDKPERGG
jgi:polyhydroxyalkanoate synthesis repressor PhaR